MDLQRRALLIGGGAALTATLAGGGARLWGARPTPGEGAPAAVTPAPAVMPAPAVQLRPASDARRLFLHNLHTGETVRPVYWAEGRYLDDGLAEARRALRDWRTGEQHPMDFGLFDVLHDLSARLEVERPFQIISGYRSPATNARLHARSAGVARSSLHMQGKAMDLRLEGVDLAHVRKAALRLGRGGVGYYPSSNFVHVDTGRVRQWAGA